MFKPKLLPVARNLVWRQARCSLCDLASLPPKCHPPSFEVKDIPQLFKQSAVWTRETGQNYPGGSQKSWPAGSRPKTAGTPLSSAGWCGAGRTGRLRHRCRICCGSLHPCRDGERKILFQSCLCYMTVYSRFSITDCCFLKVEDKGRNTESNCEPSCCFIRPARHFYNTTRTKNSIEGFSLRTTCFLACLPPLFVKSLVRKHGKLQLTTGKCHVTNAAPRTNGIPLAVATWLNWWYKIRLVHIETEGSSNHLPSFASALQRLSMGFFSRWIWEIQRI